MKTKLSSLDFFAQLVLKHFCQSVFFDASIRNLQSHKMFKSYT